ncbi:MAG: ABC transporter permease [Lachnospiraceae bacterium]|nr:ABC transporter permease [Lachnospiraceae bacterium]
MVRNTFRKIFKRSETIAAVLCIALVLVLTFASDIFWDPRNLHSLQISIVPTGMIAFGMMFLLICGYFDMSVGSIMLLSAIAAGKFTMMGMPVPVVILLTLCIGLIMGCINGYMVSVLGINALIATLGMQYIGYGAAMLLWDKVRTLETFDAGYIILGDGEFGGMYVMTWVLIVMIVIFSFFLKYTSNGKKLYFVGGNKEAAKLMGFNDKRIIFIAYAMTGVLASLAAIFRSAYVHKPTQYMGEGIHMTCFIACVIGGGSFAGGKGSIIGATLGVIFMALLTNMFNLLRMSPELQNIVVGISLVAVVTLDGYMNIKKLRLQGKI